ncbi:hypothetical protein DSO57_1027839 [Entomophthora muscae]|uniref:Uncharacterized protein n=1 Tax=Entomophthora muscae TaxID=34485 RepID=A0ACC2RSR2_9FUNG|nr:hypothetical protein DSO57_1027839 [Entomophthora muscae]
MFLEKLLMLFFFALISCTFWSPGLCLQCNRTLGKSALANLNALSVPSRLRVTGKLLSPILRKRVSGTENNTLVREFIKGQLEALNWHVEIDSFEAQTPLKVIPFHNIIATKNFKAPRKLIFAAHYDSKYFSPPNDNFIAATDSAVSCAILIDLAISLNALLDKQKDDSVSIQLVFFDGEEAFKEWNDEDSVYGARHLAARWKRESAISRFDHFSNYQSRLDSIELFVLLDLLGSENTPLYSLKKNTHNFYLKLSELETKLMKYKLSPPTLKQRQIAGIPYFGARVDDDHRPFEKSEMSVFFT